MSACSETPLYSDDFDENAWLNDIYSKIGAIPSTQPKKTDSKTRDESNRKIKSKKSDTVTKKSSGKKRSNKTS